MGIVTQAYQKYESGRIEMNYGQLYFIARRLEVSINYLLGVSDIFDLE